MQNDNAVCADLEIDPGSGSIIPSVAIDRIIAQRSAGIAAFMAGLGQIQDAQTSLAGAAGKDWLTGLAEIVSAGLMGRNPRDSEVIRRQVARCADQDIWQRLMNDTGMFTLMSAAQRKKWEAALYSDTCPEITLDTVLATFQQLHATKNETFEQGVIDVFRALSWDYKTNNPCQLGKKIILNGVLDVFGGDRRCVMVRRHAQDRLNDLARAFWLIEGKPVPDFRVSEGVRFSEFIAAGASQVSALFTCEWFTIKAYWKGTAHVTFTHPTLVEKVNDIVARHYPGALPPAV